MDEPFAMWSLFIGSDHQAIQNRCTDQEIGRNYRNLILGSGFWVLGSGFWVLGSGFWVLGSGFWVLGSGFWVLGSGFWVLGSGFWQ